MYLVRGKAENGYHELVPQQNAAGLKWISFGHLRLGRGEVHEATIQGREAVLVLLSGAMRVSAGHHTFGPYERPNVFAAPATAVYVPVGQPFRVENAGDGALEVAVCQAVAEEIHEPFVVTPDEVQVKTVGQANFERKVHDIVVQQGEGRVHRIIVGETFNPPGNWSSYPPHKHDEYIPGV